MDSPWVMFQSWRELLFAHWPIKADELRPLVPPELIIEEFDGRAWIGITPFRVEGLRARFLPAVPGVSDFPEINVRTYVRVGDHRGVYFFSLDAGNRLVVLGARTTYALPYHHATMRIDRHADGWIDYFSDRTSAPADFRARYRPAGEEFTPESGTLEHFLVERYALFTVTSADGPRRTDIKHPPWRLRPADAVIERNTMAAAAGITLPDRTPVVHYAEQQDTWIALPVADDAVMADTR